MTRVLQFSLPRYVGIKILPVIALIVVSLNNFVLASDYLQITSSENIHQKKPANKNNEFIEGEVLVRYRSNATIETQQYTATNLGGRLSKRIGGKSKLAMIKLQEGINVMEAIQAFKADPNVEHAQPNYIYSATATIPNDLSYSQLWGLKNTGQTISNAVYATNNPGTVGNDIDAEMAWDQITDCRSALVAVLDTGINYSHTDLAENMWDGSGAGFPNHGFDFVDNDNDPMPTSGGEIHGTHVAGTIGAVGNNSTGVTGVCWRASIMAVRVLGTTSLGTTAAIIQGIEFASDNGAKIINMSLGREVPFDALYNDAISYARNMDVVVVVAAGNGGLDDLGDDNDGLGDDGDPSTHFYPCNITQDNLLCIAAVDQSFTLASFSNYGASSVDLGAPGTNTLSSVPGQIIRDDFTSGWTLTGGWDDGFCLPYNILSNPPNWCSFGTYLNNADDRAYKSFNLNGAIAAELEYYRVLDTESGFDFFSTAMKSDGGDPFAGGGSILQSESGSTSGFWEPDTYDISSCNTSTCSLGFQLTSDISVVDFGIAISRFKIQTLQTNSTSYDLFSGTSMATPHVAGIAAMVRAFNPDYTYTQTIEAIINGGEVVAGLSGITTTGRAANAMGAIAHITEPTGLSAVIQ